MDGQNSYRAGPDDSAFRPLWWPLCRRNADAAHSGSGGRYKAAQTDPAFEAELVDLQTHYVGRPSPLYFAERLTEHFGGAKIYLKRDELNHTGSHKINNCLGQILLARRMGKTRIIAETGAGQHGVAVATAAARLACRVRFSWAPPIWSARNRMCFA